MSGLSVTEFKDLISSGAIVFCTNKEDCLEVIDILQSLGFPMSETIMDFEDTDTYLSPGLNVRNKTVITRFANRFIGEYLLKTQANTIVCFGQIRTIIRFEQVPFKEFYSRQSDENFDECFTRFLLT